MCPHVHVSHMHTPCATELRSARASTGIPQRKHTPSRPSACVGVHALLSAGSPATSWCSYVRAPCTSIQAYGRVPKNSCLRGGCKGMMTWHLGTHTPTTRSACQPACARGEWMCGLDRKQCPVQTCHSGCMQGTGTRVPAQNTLHTCCLHVASQCQQAHMRLPLHARTESHMTHQHDTPSEQLVCVKPHLRKVRTRAYSTMAICGCIDACVRLRAWLQVQVRAPRGASRPCSSRPELYLQPCPWPAPTQVEQWHCVRP